MVREPVVQASCEVKKVNSKIKRAILMQALARAQFAVQAKYQTAPKLLKAKFEEEFFTTELHGWLE